MIIDDNVQLILKNGCSETWAINAFSEAMKLEAVQKSLEGKKIIKVIVVKDELVSIVAK